MTETLIIELVAIIRQTAGDPGQKLVERLREEPFAPSEATLRELARRAERFGATDEELALSLGALFAAPPSSAVVP